MTGQAVDFTGNPNLLSQKTGNRVTDAPTEGASRRFRVRSRPNRSAARTGRPNALQNTNKAMVVASASNAYCIRNAGYCIRKAPRAGKLEAFAALFTTFEKTYIRPL